MREVHAASLINTTTIYSVLFGAKKMYIQVSESQVQGEAHHIRSALKHVQLLLSDSAVLR